MPCVLGAALDAIERIARGGTCTCGVIGDLLAFLDILRTSGKDERLAAALDRERARIVDLDYIIYLRDKNTRLGLVESSSEVEACVTPLKGREKPTEDNLTRSNRAIDAVKDAQSPSRVDIEALAGERVEAIGTHNDFSLVRENNLCRYAIEDLHCERQSKPECSTVRSTLPVVTRDHGNIARWCTTEDSSVGWRSGARLGDGTG